MITRNNFDVPVFEYYKNGGKYSGSRRGCEKHGGLHNDFNYKIAVEQADGDDPALEVHIWYGELCFECSPDSMMIASEQFAADTDGLALAYEYIDAAYDTWADLK
jgi:hypothetical protein